MSQFIKIGDKIINLDKIISVNKYICKYEEDSTYTQVEIIFSDSKTSFTEKEAEILWDFISNQSQNILRGNI